jgi:hypothetical protein
MVPIEQVADKFRESFLQGLKPIRLLPATPGLKPRPPMEGPRAQPGMAVPPGQERPPFLRQGEPEGGRYTSLY